MQISRPFSWMGLLLVATIVVVPACGNDPNSTAGGGGTTTTSTTSSTTTPTGGGGTTSTTIGGTGGTTMETGATSTGASAGTGTGATGTGATGTGATAGSTTGGSGGTTTTTTTTSTVTNFEPVKCQSQTYECGDAIDNDMDGLIDWTDPDCLGPCDNTEGSYYGGIPGQSGPNCDVDCYWDNDSGNGNDECYWNHKCDSNEIMDPGHPEPNSKCPYNPNANISGTPLSCDEAYNMQGPVCATVCGPLTPNGCDCFGCCELPTGSGKFVWLGSEDEATGEGSCFADVIDDPTKCEPCIPVKGCYNDCAPCELCIGKDPADIPPECGGGGAGGAGGVGGMGGAGGMQCPMGLQECGLPGLPPCPTTHYCVTGCCQPLP